MHRDDKICLGPKYNRGYALIRSIGAVADVADILSVEIVRGRSFRNRFEEAADMVKRYPEMSPYLPSVRKPWEAEPKALIYFEALSLIESLLGQPRPNQNHG